jgi:hypothetical protein
VDTLALKLVLTPALIGAASVAGRRWGQGVGGWLVGLPLTSGPVVFFLELDHGRAFAGAAAVGCLAGAIAEAAFCLVYGRLAFRVPWPLTLLASCVVFAAAATLLQCVALALVWLVPLVVVALAVALWLLPPGSHARVAAPPPRWDLPARMTVTTGLVLLLTAAAPTLGPRLAGLLATFPLYAAVLTVFAHHLEGPTPALEVLRGLLLGLFGFAGFFVVLAVLLDEIGAAPAFTAAVAVALVFQAGSLALVLRRK